MSKFPLKLEDLNPKETTFKLSTLPEVTLTLCRWSLRVRSWALAKYTAPGLEEIFKMNKIQEIAEIAYFMLKEKEIFEKLATKEMPAFDAFLDSIVTIQDKINLTMGLLGSVGIGEPEIKRITDVLEKPEGKPADPNEPSPNLTT